MTVPATTVIEPLAAESDSASPLVRCATRVSDSAFVYCTVLSVFELVPAVIVPVLFATIPEPDGLSVTSVLATTLDALP